MGACLGLTSINYLLAEIQPPLRSPNPVPFSNQCVLNPRPKCTSLTTRRSLQQSEHKNIIRIVYICIRTNVWPLYAFVVDVSCIYVVADAKCVIRPFPTEHGHTIPFHKLLVNCESVLRLSNGLCVNITFGPIHSKIRNNFGAKVVLGENRQF